MPDLKNLAKRALGQTDYQQKVKAQRESDKIVLDQQIYEARQAGKKEGAIKAAKAKGVEEGQRIGSQQGGFGGFSAKLGGNLERISGAIGNTEKMFGFSGGNMGGGLDFGLPGMGGQSEKKPRAKTTKIISGGRTITIKETVEGETSERKKKQSGSPYNWMNDMPNFFDNE